MIFLLPHSDIGPRIPGKDLFTRIREQPRKTTDKQGNPMSAMQTILQDVLAVREYISLSLMSTVLMYVLPSFLYLCTFPYAQMIG